MCVYALVFVCSPFVRLMAYLPKDNNERAERNYVNIVMDWMVGALLFKSFAWSFLRSFSRPVGRLVGCSAYNQFLVGQFVDELH